MTQTAPWHDGLTEKQRRFVEAYAGSGNAYQAAIAAGYKTPLQQSGENMKKPDIVRAIESLRLTTTSAAMATREERQG